MPVLQQKKQRYPHPIDERADNGTQRRAEKIAAAIRAEANGRTCGGCLFAVIVGDGGICTHWNEFVHGQPLMLLTAAAPACGAWEKRKG